MFLSFEDIAQKPYYVQAQVTVCGSEEFARLTVGSVALKAEHHGSKLKMGADTYLARPTSRCRRTDSIVSLERGVVLVPNCKSFLVTEAERKHVRRSARFHQYGDASCHQVLFFPLQGKAPKEIHSILTETVGEHAPS